MSIVITTTIIMDARISLRQQAIITIIKDKQQLSLQKVTNTKTLNAIIIINQQRLPQRKNYTDIRNAVNSQAIIEQGRHDGSVFFYKSSSSVESREAGNRRQQTRTGASGSHKYKYAASPSPVRSRSSKRERYASRSRSPRPTRYAESPTESPRSVAHHYYRNRRSSSRYRRSRSKLSPVSRSRSRSRSPSSTPRDLKQKRIEYSKKISETSLFAELVKDKHKRQKALQEIIEKQEENSNSNGALAINDNSSSLDSNVPAKWL
ncbi:Cyclin-dependent kinase 12 [Eumeta japonica]|uniref:Cyclin-dependent kinase 12 n=1 Tax=Eumeta variegata TaxID=151549 RepID=A0A4C1TJS5_EUMVA|nr:Cyclin-dependent kinase 12 [Eumeta japonica]